MTIHSGNNSRRLSACIGQLLMVISMSTVVATTASAQIRIGNVTIGKPKPDPNKPPTTNPTVSTPNANGNKTPTISANGETGATREQVSEFNRDMEPYRQGMSSLKWWATSTDSIRSGCGEVSAIRRALSDGAAFLEIIKQKYPGIENPSWSQGNAEHHLVGDFRRAAENREAIVKKCVNGLMGAKLDTEIKGIQAGIADFDKSEGYVLRRDFDDKTARHLALTERWKANYAEVGLTMPDESVFAEYDAAHERLVALAAQNAGRWVWPPEFHDVMIETKARAWLKNADPKATLVKIGILHGDWQVNHHPNGVPSGRYKRGYVMFRKPGVQQCLVNNFSYEQNYIGGGRFNQEAATSGMSHTLRMQTCK